MALIRVTTGNDTAYQRRNYSLCTTTRCLPLLLKVRPTYEAY
jgi:hypothetical protein